LTYAKHWGSHHHGCPIISQVTGCPALKFYRISPHTSVFHWNILIRSRIPSDEIDENESLKNYVRFLSELAKPVKIEVITDLGVRKFEINSTKVSSLISSTANL